MDIKQFRIGNTLEAKIKEDYNSDLLWKTITVSGIECNKYFDETRPDKIFFLESDISTFNVFRKYTKLDDEFLRPIPLTKELLLKLGFKKMGEKAFFCNGVQIYFSNNSFEVENFGDVDFVHQLQNLYFVLTGGELI